MPGLDRLPMRTPNPAADELARRRAEQELLMRQRQQAMQLDEEQAARARASAPLDLAAKQQALTANTAQEGRAANKAANETGANTMKADALRWAGDKSNPQYHVAWDALPEEAKQHFGPDTYGENAAKAPDAYNAAFQQSGGVIPGLEHLQVSGATTDESGNTTIHRSIPGLETAGQVTEKDVADAGVDPASIARSEWPSAVAKAKAGREGKMTEMQSNALQYSARMASNNSVLGELEKAGFNPATVGNSVQDSRLAPNIIRDENVQKYVAARDNWISAVLRKESGAAISKSEYENAYKQYFPQMGDKPGVVNQKAALRRLAENNMRLVAGGRAADAETHANAPQPTETHPAEQTATNKATGERMVLRNGKWEPL